jgi:DNA-binding transcriptional LysR family regulator
VGLVWPTAKDLSQTATVIDLNELQIFARVVEANGFAAAGRQLGLPVSTVSRAISRLERRLGAQLLRRTTRRLSLTDAGVVYHRHCERLLAEAAAAEAAIGGFDLAPRGVLRVSAPITFGRFLLAPIIGAFCAQHPELRPVVVLTNRYVDLVEEGFDLAIRTGALADSNLGAKHLGDSPLVIAASPACLERHGMPRDRHIFETAPCLVLGEQADAGRWVFVERGETVALQVKAAVVANDMDLLRHAALGGLGFVMLPSFLIAAELASGTLRAIEGDWQLVRGEVHAVYPRHRVASPKVRVLIDYLREQLAGVPRWIPPAPR